MLAGRTAGAADRFTLARLPHHLTGAGRWADLEAVLMDWRFLEAKAAAGMAFELADDITSAVAWMPADRFGGVSLRLIGEAIRRDQRRLLA